MKEMKSIKLRCASVFASYSIEYIEANLALGKKWSLVIALMNQFDHFCVKHDVAEPVLTEEMFNAFCELHPNESPSNQYLRINFLRNFSKHLSDCGIVVPMQFHPMRQPKTNFKPYIFTYDELNRILAVVDTSAPNIPNSPVRQFVMPLLFRMLYCCGLRINEALQLKTDDVDLENGVLWLYRTKGNQERIVPMSETLTALCRQYRAKDEVKNFGGDYFFPAPDRGFYSSRNIYKYFRRWLQMAGVTHGGRGKGPRIHDFRHTFAVHTLSKWAAEGKDIYVCLPILSTYLGHKNLERTQQYLRLVPENYADVTSAFEACFSDVFPEVPHEEQ